MKSHARAVVIGGGVGGCSALYHLTREGWTDVVLLERNELTSGTTWHSAAQCPNVSFSQLLIQLRSYTIQLYKELAGDPDDPINYHHAVGGMWLATQPAHLEHYRHVISMAKAVGVEFELIDAADCARRNPLINTERVLQALWDPLDGDIDPAQLCQALARRARLAGAEIHRQTPAIGLRRDRGEWVVSTPKGEIRCEVVVNAAGYRVNEIGAMIDVVYPVVSLEHMYFVTSSVPALAGRAERVAMVRSPEETFYMRQERDALLLGVYEHDCRTFGLDGVDPDFVNALCPSDLERCLPKLERIMALLPCLAEVGFKTIVNGPITYAPDAMPLVGKMRGLPGLYSMNGLRVGIGEGGGYGKALAQLIVHGEAEWDVWPLDPRRITRFATIAYTAAKAIEDYQNEFRFHLPHEHRPAGRPAKTTPLYAEMQAAGAVFVPINGWERVAYFKPTPDFVGQPSFGFPNWTDAVGAEILALAASVGLSEVSGFNRIEIAGAAAFDWLDGIFCGPVPRQVGEVRLGYCLTPGGKLLSEATLACLAPDRIWFGSAAAAEDHDMDWLEQHVSSDGSIELRSLTDSHTLLLLAGPKARALMSAASPEAGWSAQDLPPGRCRRCRIGGADALAMTLSYSGASAIELHVANDQLAAAHRALTEAGAAVGLARFGLYAAESMRLEMGHGHWKADLTSDLDPFEAGLDRFVDLSKPFIGRDALAARQARGPRLRLATLILDSAALPAQPDDAILQGDRAIGSVTSAGWGWRTQRNIALAHLAADCAAEGTELAALVLGQRIRATVSPRRLLRRRERRSNGRQAP